VSEPDSLPRGGSLPRDRNGFDVGIVPCVDGSLRVRRHSPKGDDEWGLMKKTDSPDEFEFESTHSDTSTSHGTKGDIYAVFSAVVKDAGGTLPKSE
jgi:hypothetical protein